jgi:GNAT superfamily N-acetyltransferase
MLGNHSFEHCPSFMMPYNAAYYDAHIKVCGYEKATDFFAYHLEVADFQYTMKMQRINDYLKKRYNVRFRTVNLKDFQREGALIREIYNDAFSTHYGYLPFELDEFYYMAKDMTQVMDKNLLFVLEINEETVGFLLALPNLNTALRHLPKGKLFPFGFLKLLWHKRNINRVRVINIAIRQRFQHLGLGSLFYEEVIKRLKSGNYIGGEISWVVETNTAMINAAEALGGKIGKVYRLYQKNF